MTTPLALDTPADIERRQIRRWRTMRPSEKSAIITGLTAAAYEMCLAGVQQRYPDATPREQFLRRAILTLGRDLASQAYPEIDQLGLA